MKMTQVKNPVTGNQEKHFNAVIVSIATEEILTVKANGETGAPYKPFSAKFENESDEMVTRSGLLFTNQYKEAKVGDEIACAIVYSPGRVNKAGVKEEFLLVSRLEAAERVSDTDVFFSEVSVATDAPVGATA